MQDDRESELFDWSKPPPGWPTTPRPRSIAFLGWGRLSAQGREGSGYNLSASELATGLGLMGHTVSFLRSGMDYSFRPGMHVREVEPWRGIRCWHLVNSPNLSPAVFNFTNMEAECSSPEQTAVVMSWLDSVQAELVHIHSLEGFSLDLVPAIRDSGRRIVVTTHNYWWVCPQVDLLHNEVEVCMDYEGGKACEGCLKPAPAYKARARRRLEQTSNRRLGPTTQHMVRRFVIGRKQLIKPNLPKLKAGPVDPDGVVDPELALGFDVTSVRDHEGTVVQDAPVPESELPPQLGRSPLDQNERFLAATHHLAVLNNYGQRRLAGAASLNAADLVIPPSRFMCRVYERMGVDGSRVRHVRLGQPHFDRINRRVRRSPWYTKCPWTPEDARRPLRLAYFGTTRHNKGLDILARAIPLLDRDIRQRCQFTIRAAHGDGQFRRRLSPYPEVSFLGGYDLVQLVNAGGDFDVGILPHIWFENSPLVLLEFLHAGKFVISSRLGGPPEWICEPGSPEAEGNGGLGNGLMFPGGHPEELAERITRVVRGEVVLPSAAEVHAVSVLQSYPDHVREIDAIYRTLLGESGSPRPLAASASGERPEKLTETGRRS